MSMEGLCFPFCRRCHWWFGKDKVGTLMGMGWIGKRAPTEKGQDEGKEECVTTTDQALKPSWTLGLLVDVR